MAKITMYGDKGLRICFAEEIAFAINQQVRHLAHLLTEAKLRGIIEWIPTYNAVTIYYNPVLTTYEELAEKITALISKMAVSDLPQARVIEIPTCYGEEYGPDIVEVARVNQLTVEEVIQLHSTKDYLVYMLGFAAGFPYLGGMDLRLATPRLAVPRMEIPAGSVGIAGAQTGIYPLASPGGWQIIGRTPVKLFDLRRSEPILFESGDYLRFVPVTREEYEGVKQAVLDNTYQVKIWEEGAK